MYNNIFVICNIYDEGIGKSGWGGVSKNLVRKD